MKHSRNSELKLMLSSDWGWCYHGLPFQVFWWVVWYCRVAFFFFGLLLLYWQRPESFFPCCSCECSSSLKQPSTWKIDGICSRIDLGKVYCCYSSKKETVCKSAHLLKYKNKSSLSFSFSAFCSIVRIGLGNTSTNPSLGQFSGYLFFIIVILFRAKY